MLPEASNDCGAFVCIFISFVAVLVAAKSEGDACVLRSFESAVRGKFRGPSEVVLQHQTHAVSAASIAANCIDAIAESGDVREPPIFRRVTEAASDARVPVTRLAEP